MFTAHFGKGLHTPINILFTVDSRDLDADACLPLGHHRVAEANYVDACWVEDKETSRAGLTHAVAGKSNMNGIGWVDLHCCTKTRKATLLLHISTGVTTFFPPTPIEPLTTSVERTIYVLHWKKEIEQGIGGVPHVWL